VLKQDYEKAHASRQIENFQALSLTGGIHQSREMLEVR
jgi:hypothetical protein